LPILDKIAERGSERRAMIHLFKDNGYLAIFVTVAVSGELGLLAGVALAHAGSVTMTGVIIVGTLAASLGNTLYYYAGVYLWDKWTFLQRRFGEKVNNTTGIVQKAGPPLMTVSRFFYGIRNIVPLTIGVYRTNIAVFTVYNIVGSLIWAWASTEAGNLLSLGIMRFFGA
jgi:membrane protein DedA with SNARE-associated domain